MTQNVERESAIIWYNSSSNFSLFSIDIVLKNTFPFFEWNSTNRLSFPLIALSRPIDFFTDASSKIKTNENFQVQIEEKRIHFKFECGSPVCLCFENYSFVEIKKRRNSNVNSLNQLKWMKRTSERRKKCIWKTKRRQKRGEFIEDWTERRKRKHSFFSLFLAEIKKKRKISIAFRLEKHSIS